MKTSFLLLTALALASAALADDRIFTEPAPPPQIDSNMEALPSQAEVAQALTRAAMNDPRVTEHLERLARCKADAKTSSRMSCKEGIDLRVGVPEGVAVAFTYTPVAPLTVGVSVGGTGPTVAVNAEATFNILWNSNLTPTITVQFSNIYFTGMTDDIANGYVKQLYGDQITVKMAGKWMQTASALAGVDWVTNSGLHLLLRGGIMGQLGTTHGGDNSNGDIVLRGWWGPAAELGIGGTFSWF